MSNLKTCIKCPEFNKEKDIRKDAPDIPAYGVDKLAKYKYVKGGAVISGDDGGKPIYGQQKFFELEKRGK
jgi:hypothetical protein